MIISTHVYSASKYKDVCLPCKWLTEKDDYRLAYYFLEDLYTLNNWDIIFSPR